jgi:hypothetical protein
MDYIIGADLLFGIYYVAFARNVETLKLKP